MIMKQLFSGLLLSIAICLTAVQPATAQPTRLAYIDGQRIENDTKRAFDIAESLRREFSARETELRAGEARLKAQQSQLSGIKEPRERETKEREFQTAAQRFEQQARAFVDDLERRKAEERRKYFQEVTQIVTQMAAAQKFDLVVQEAVFASKAIDITESVIKVLGGPAPRQKP
jgi:outer membrane protein